MTDHPSFHKKSNVTYTKTQLGTALFYIPGGQYSIADLEELLEHIKAMKAIQDNHLTKSMGELK
jgi:hypothetical protein